jgi:acrylyl-CoA reductase (NADPH)
VEIIDRLSASAPAKPLLPQRWAGVIDTVGGDTLSIALRTTRRHGAVACCGNVASPNLDVTVYPFILRGIALIGIDSATTEMDTRKAIWHHMAEERKFKYLAFLTSTIGLEDLDHHIEKIIKSRQIGRRVVDLND